MKKLLLVLALTVSLIAWTVSHCFAIEIVVSGGGSSTLVGSTLYYSTGVTAIQITSTGGTIFNTSGDILMTFDPGGLWGVDFDTVEAGVSVFRVVSANTNLTSIMKKGVHVQPQQGTVSYYVDLPAQASGSTLYTLWSDYGSGVTFRTPTGTSVYVQNGSQHAAGNTIWCAPGSPGSKILFMSGVSMDGTYFVDCQVSGVSWQVQNNVDAVVGNTWVQ